jgi:hypothetical protein
MAVDIGEEAFVKKRRIGLADFLRRILTHPTLQTDAGPRRGKAPPCLLGPHSDRSETLMMSGLRACPGVWTFLTTPKEEPWQGKLTVTSGEGQPVQYSPSQFADSLKALGGSLRSGTADQYVSGSSAWPFLPSRSWPPAPAPPLSLALTAALPCRRFQNLHHYANVLQEHLASLLSIHGR